MRYLIVLNILFVVVSAAILASTPIVAAFQIRDFSCDFGASRDWMATVFNWKHLISYGAFATVGFLALTGRPFWLAAAILLGVMAGAELTQAIFDDGHCRLRDMLPNALALGIGAVFAVGIRGLFGRRLSF